MRFVDTATGEVVGEVALREPDVFSLLSDEHFKFTPVGLEVVGSPSFLQCEIKYGQLQELKRLSLIYLGDLLNYMEIRWGDKYAQALDPTGYAYQTAANAKSVMGKVDPSVRQPGLTFTHYSTAAPLPQSDQQRLLKRARDEEMNTSEFKRVVRRERRQAREGNLPALVKMEVSMTFSVPADLKDKLRFSVEGLANRLEEWDIECEYMDISEMANDGR